MYSLKNEQEFLRIAIGKIMKILYLYEERSPTLHKYIQNVLIEFDGFEKIFDELHGRNEFFIILATLEALSLKLAKPIFDDKNHKLIRTQVLKCTNMLSRLGDKNKG